MGQAALVSETVVRVRALCKRYRRQLAVRGVDLAVRRGEIYGLIGPDGSGKSSLMKAIAGVLAFEAGTVEVFGVPVDSERNAERVKARLGFMPQGLGLNLYPDLSVEENLDFFARLREVPAAELAERKRRLLAATGLEPFRDRPMKHLSGGMKQKLGLICTLIHEPELVILDEPTTGVDPLSRREFWQLLAELVHTRGITALVSTAYLDEAARFHRLTLMTPPQGTRGNVLAAGTPEELLARVPGWVVVLAAEPQLEALKRLRSRYPQVEALGTQIRVFVTARTTEEAAQAAVLERLAGLRVRSVQVSVPELEDVFIALLRARGVEIPVVSLPPARGRCGAVVIEAHGLSRDFDGFRAVDQVSFQVCAGELFGLLGANGAGKTTVIRMLTGLLPPSAGEGRVAGVAMGRAGVKIRERIGYMSQAFSLYRDLTVAENLDLFARIYGVPWRQRTRRRAEVVALAGLAGREHQLAGELPLGVRQRLALACALLHRPQVLFLDEPTSGVDPIGRRRFWDILVQLARGDGVAILVTTHYLSEAEHCDRLVLMAAGRVVAAGAPVALKRALEKEIGPFWEVETGQPLQAMAVLQQAGFSVTVFGRRLHVAGATGAESIRRLLVEAGCRDVRIAAIAPTLEDVFVHRIREVQP